MFKIIKSKAQDIYFFCAKLTRINSLFLSHNKTCLNTYLDLRIIGLLEIAVDHRILKIYNDVLPKKPFVIMVYRKKTRKLTGTQISSRV